jgi:uncharacterized protein (DUF427 family)
LLARQATARRGSRTPRAPAPVVAMRARWNGRVVAESNHTVEVDGYVYFPPTAVRMELLKAAPKTAADESCPHGVQFYDVVDGSKTAARSAWSYEKPGAAMKRVDRWIGFWDEVEVAPQ